MSELITIILNPLVSISCVTFNHSKFIRECLDGFLMQKTNFPIEVVIHDDASTDGTREIIEEYTQKYPNIFFPMYQDENQFSKGVRGMMANFNFPRCRGKYIALCEGDDYWTDPLKLQKEVVFLESNIEYSIHYSNSINDRTKEHNSTRFGTFTFKDSLHNGKFGSTLTCMVRSSIFKNPKYNILKFLSFSEIGDWPIEIMATLDGKGYVSDHVTGIYRVHDTSMIRTLKTTKRTVRYNFSKFVLRERIFDDKIIIDQFKKLYWNQWKYQFKNASIADKINLTFEMLRFTLK